MRNPQTLHLDVEAANQYQCVIVPKDSALKKWSTCLCSYKEITAEPDKFYDAICTNKLPSKNASGYGFNSDLFANLIKYMFHNETEYSRQKAI